VRLSWPLAVAVLLLVSACGGSSRLSASAYRAHLVTVGKESDTAQHNVEKGFLATSVAQLAKVLTRFAAAEKGIGDEVAGLKAPKDAEAANAELANGLQDTASEAEAIVPKVEKMPSAKAAIAFLQKSAQTQGGRELDDALAKLKKLGYIKKVS
jgi:hypothetical protein